MSAPQVVEEVKKVEEAEEVTAKEFDFIASEYFPAQVVEAIRLSGVSLFLRACLDRTLGIRLPDSVKFMADIDAFLQDEFNRPPFLNTLIGGHCDNPEALRRELANAYCWFGFAGIRNSSRSTNVRIPAPRTEVYVDYSVESRASYTHYERNMGSAAVQFDADELENDIGDLEDITRDDLVCFLEQRVRDLINDGYADYELDSTIDTEFVELLSTDMGSLEVDEDYLCEAADRFMEEIQAILEARDE